MSTVIPLSAKKYECIDAGSCKLRLQVQLNSKLSKPPILRCHKENLLLTMQILRTGLFAFAISSQLVSVKENTGTKTPPLGGT